MRPSVSQIVLVVFLAVGLWSPQSGIAQTIERGQLLYEHHCRSCHESVVHVRENQKVDSLYDLRCQVVPWASAAKLPRGVREIDDVVYYVGTTYYELVEMRPNER
jgi:hypothetical protein